jgi:hypothetical protein
MHTRTPYIPLLIAAAALSLLFQPDGRAPAVTPPAPEYPGLRSRAEELYAQGSYAMALQLYQQAATLTLPQPDARWVDFRLADCAWRAQAGSSSADSSITDAARKKLEALSASAERPALRDRVWAEAHESLADHWWTPRGSRNWSAAWPHYEQALDWWAGSSEIDLAARRYVAMVKAMAAPPWRTHYFGSASHIPIHIIENALRVAEPAAQPYLSYVLAQALQPSGAVGTRRAQLIAAYERALSAGADSEWYDDALFHYAQWLAHQGRAVRERNGAFRVEPDWTRALEVYRRIVSEFKPGQSQYVDDARRQIQEITEPHLDVTCTHIFLPGSTPDCLVAWRNLPRIDFKLYRVSLVGDLTTARMSASRDLQPEEWFDVDAAPIVRQWSTDTADAGDHRPRQQQVTIEEPPGPGAYVLLASGAGRVSRALLLITDAAIVTKSDADQTLAYVCGAIDGAPVPQARVRLFGMRSGQKGWQVRERTGTTDDSGLVRFSGMGSDDWETHLVAAQAGDREILAYTARPPTPGPETHWKIFAVTDRPAYRPEETVQWKAVARTAEDREQRTPAGSRLWYRIVDPQGAQVDEGSVTLNKFGSAWGALPLSAAMMLGAYTIDFCADAECRTHLWSGPLFRLEEYKLPEFKVGVQTASADGRPLRFRMGDAVEAEVSAEYYFGGPVAGAAVEAVVRQRPFHRWWTEPRDFPWCYPAPEDYGWWDWQGQEVARQQLVTDAQGRATVRFETPAASNSDFEYTIEARVTDASRREITGSGSLRVTRQLYAVSARPERHVLRPGEPAAVRFQARDANQHPVQVPGRVTVWRQTWREIWIDPAGREVTGEAVAQMPPAQRPAPGAGGWWIKRRGYEHSEILSRSLRTDAEGAAELGFTPDRAGYYRIEWRGPDDLDPAIGADDIDALQDPVTAETAVWVCAADSTDIGYHHDGVDIVVDRDTFKVGQSAAVMIATDTSDRHVLFTVEGERLYHSELVHVKGNAKLLMIPVHQAYAPNVSLGAALVAETTLRSDTSEIVVPPLQEYLDVSVAADRPTYEPGETAALTITARDQSGRPVAAELALAMFDESVTLIQGDLAGDPRAFFFPGRQELRVRSASSFDLAPYKRLAPEPAPNDNAARDEVDALNDRLDSSLELREHMPAGEPGSMPARAAKERQAGRGGADAFFAVAGTETMPASAAPPAEGAAGAPPAPRSDFRSTILWLPDVVTGPDGTASLEVRMADSLTTWKAVARGGTAGPEFGMGEAAVKTSKPLIARLQAPRFFVAGDTVTISGVLNNNTDAPLAVEASLQAEGLRLAGVREGGRIQTRPATSVTVPARGESRIDWIVEAETQGEAMLTLAARSGSHQDAMMRKYPVEAHGIEKLVATAAKLKGDDTTVALELPAARRPGSTRMVVQVTPSLAVTMLDALPYLIDYPYGCTEQTMSRFLPAAIVSRTLSDLGLDPEQAMGRVFGGIEQAHAGKTHPKGKRNLAELDAMVRAGFERLADFQHADGGWGWWKEGDSDRFMTAYVLWGLTLASQAEVDIDGALRDRAAGYLVAQLVEEEFEPDRQAWMLHALAVHQAAKGAAATPEMDRAFANLFGTRDDLNAYSRALLALCAHHMKRAREARILVDNLHNGVKRDDAPDTSIITRQRGASSPTVMATAHWGEDGVWWRWSDGPVEATAFALRAILAIDPGHELVEPVVNWLIKNRRGAQWSNTRDTAVTLLALNDFLRVSRELESELSYELSVNGHVIATRSLTRSDILTAPSRFEVDEAHVRGGPNEIRVRRTAGSGPLYASVQATFFAQEEPVTAAGHEIFVRRQYVKLVPRPTLLRGFVYDRVPMSDEDYVTSGQRIEVLLTIEAKNEYEYLVFEDLKPAGLEAVKLRSGEPVYAHELKSAAVQRSLGGPLPAADAAGEPGDHTGRSRWVYQELRDRAVALFLDRLPEGVWEMRYELRAEVPGRFHALPVLGHAMYVPEIRCNGDEVRMTVQEE